MISTIDGPIMRSDMHPRLCAKLRDQERDLGRKCRRLWTFTNRHGERFTFGSFGGDRLIVTVARFEPLICAWIWPPLGGA